MYEIHVKGFTMRHPDIPPALQGTYAGLGHEAAIAHLTGLGVTAVELLPGAPARARVVPGRRAGLTNYWGYNTIGFFAPHNGYSAAVRAGQPGGQVAEFKAMVAALHRPGLEVILDVVFNHTAEGDRPARRCASAASTTRPTTAPIPTTPAPTSTPPAAATPSTPATRMLQLMMDSLRYWVTEMHVDGFRFDLAPTLARQEGGFDQYPRSSTCAPRTRWYARPSWSPSRGTSARWTATTWAGSRRCGGSGTASTATACGTSGAAPRSASASSPTGFTGSADLYATAAGAHRLGQPDHRPRRVHPAPTSSPTTTSTTRPTARTTATGRPTTAPGTAAPRAPPPTRISSRCAARQSRAMLATLLLSFGVPMLLGGDEMGRTQGGNNNAYCQDNEITWFDWASADTGAARLHQDPARSAAPTRSSAAAASWPAPRPPS